VRSCEICGQDIETYNQANYLGGRKQYWFHLECYQYYRVMEPSELGYEVLELLVERGEMEARDIIYILNRGASGINKQLKKLTEADFIKRVRRGVYTATIDGKEKIDDRIRQQ